MEDLLNNLGINPIWIAVIMGLILTLERVGKAIPDSATGVLGIIRKVSKVLGFYIPNRQ